MVDAHVGDGRKLIHSRSRSIDASWSALIARPPFSRPDRPAWPMPPMRYQRQCHAATQQHHSPISLIPSMDSRRRDWNRSRALVQSGGDALFPRHRI
jgi:hypothetical protein